MRSISGRTFLVNSSNAPCVLEPIVNFHMTGLLRWSQALIVSWQVHLLDIALKHSSDETPLISVSRYST